MKEDDNAQYVERLADGDEGAWRRFFGEQGRMVLALAGKLGVLADDRDEVLQNTAVITHRSISQLRDPSRLTAWVYRIAYRQCLEMRNRRRREPVEGRDPAHLTEIPQADATAIDDLVVQVEVGGQLRQALDSMGGSCAELLTLLYLAEPRPRYEEVSDQLGMPIGSIGPTRARCLEKLRKELKTVSIDH